MQNTQKKHIRKSSSFILCIVLIVAMALFATGCSGGTSGGTASGSGQETAVQTNGAVLGEGNTQFTFTIIDKEGGETQLEIHTDKETVGDALAELGLISGEESEYGLYVQTVNGITVDYDKDGVYWAFYINGEYAPTGVDSTAITEGDSYSFKVE
jgi:hypothetical protein